MRVRVGGTRVAEQQLKARKKGKWRQQGYVFVSVNGRIMLKDLQGKSYM